MVCSLMCIFAWIFLNGYLNSVCVYFMYTLCFRFGEIFLRVEIVRFEVCVSVVGVSYIEV